MKKRRVYIASPYTLGDKEQNVIRSIKAGDEIMKIDGFIPFLPLLYHYWEKHSPEGKTYKMWLQLCFDWLMVCDCVLRLDGESSGADDEVRLAHDLHIPVFFSIEELKEYYKICDTEQLVKEEDFQEIKS